MDPIYLPGPEVFLTQQRSANNSHWQYVIYTPNFPILTTSSSFTISHHFVMLPCQLLQL